MAARPARDVAAGPRASERGHPWDRPAPPGSRLQHPLAPAVAATCPTACRPTSCSSAAGAASCSARPSPPPSGCGRRCAARRAASATSASTPASRTCWWRRRRPSCSSTRRTPTGSTWPATAAGPPTQRRGRARRLRDERRRRAPSTPSTRTAGMLRADPALLLAQRRAARSFTYLVAEEPGTGRVIGTVTGVDHVEAFGDPEGGTQPVVPRRRPAEPAGRRRRAPDPRAGRALRGARPGVRRPVGAARQPPGDQPVRAGRLRPGAGAGAQAQEHRSTSGCSSARPARTTSGSTRTPGSSPTRPGAAASTSRCSTPSGASCGCRTPAAAS